MATASVCEIQLFPIKSFDPIEVQETTVLASGALAFDRRWAFIDAAGRFINGKNRIEVHSIRASYRLDEGEVSLDGQVFSLVRQQRAIEAWMTNRLNEPVAFHENVEVGFPDDLVSPGPTFVGRESLRAVADWYDLSLSEARRRFRTNVEFEGGGAFWEDHFYGSCFSVGPVKVQAMNACQRCVVPTRDSTTGAVTARFQKSFAEHREANLPSTADASRFNHYYRFAVNTRIDPSEAGKVIHVGDPITF